MKTTRSSGNLSHSQKKEKDGAKNQKSGEIYSHEKIEKKWQKSWDKSKIYKVTDKAGKKPKAYILDMFPYPSGTGLHVGHPKGYIATDVYSRFKMMNGYNILHPMGWDAFGLPAEEFAIKNKIHPNIAVKKNIETYKKQLSILGFNYDWSREVNTTDPEFYKWTQWTFIQMFKKGLVVESHEPINWCPSCKTGLANEDLDNGRCERCNSIVEKKPMRQWVIKITDYADRLLKDLDEVQYDMPKLVDKKNPHRKGASLVKRHVVHAIVFDPKKNKYLIIRNKKHDWDTTIIGGIEGKETPLEAALREVKEETGYVDIEFKRFLGGQTEASYYTKHKCENRVAFATGIYFELKSDKRVAIKEDEDKSNEVIWISPEDFVVGKMVNSEMPVWLERLKDPTKGFPKPVLNWPESIKESQRNWIGRSEATEIDFKLQNVHASIRIVTTRPDTIFGSTFLVIAPEHAYIDKYKDKIENIDEVLEYRAKAMLLEEFERGKVKKEKTGVQVKGLEAIHPFTKEAMPVYVSDFVIPGYGTGAIMAVPGHDDRDFEFAKKFKLPIVQVIRPPKNQQKYYYYLYDEDTSALALELRKLGQKGEYMTPTVATYTTDKDNVEKMIDIFDKYKVGTPHDMALIGDGQHFTLEPGNAFAFTQVYSGDGMHINSDFLNGLTNDTAIALVNKKIMEMGIGKPAVHYRLRDWVFSRQRYWGEPIPLIHCPKCGVVPVPEKELPLKLPNVKFYEPTGTGESPLAAIDSWVNVKCPTCKGPAKRETNTMPQWAGSSWYYLRYIDPKNKKQLVDPKKEKYWQPVDMYVGGAEHATRHLIYARFWHKFLFDIGIVSTIEPFSQLKNQGLIMGPDGRKMSKRFGNVINPDDIVKTYGADTLRVYEMFMGPFDQTIAWSTDNMIGSRRFIERFWRLFDKIDFDNEKPQENSSEIKELEKLGHKTIKKVGEDIESFSFNTAISSMMIFLNALEKQKRISPKIYCSFFLILAPFAPYMTEEILEMFVKRVKKSKKNHEIPDRVMKTKSIHLLGWPSYDLSKLSDESVTVMIQINGKVRGSIIVDADDAKDEEKVKNIALHNPEIRKRTGDNSPDRIIFISGKLINLVFKSL